MVRRSALFAVVIGMLCLPVGSNVSQAQNSNGCNNERDGKTDNVTDQDHLNVWTVNLKFYGPDRDKGDYEGDCFFDELARIAALDDGQKPDLILGTEIGNGQQGRFLALMKNALGVEYAGRHTEKKGDGLNLVVWRRERLRLTSKSDVLRWQRWGPVRRGCEIADNWQIAVRLRDLLQEEFVVAASVHYGAKDDYCIDKNVIRTESSIDRKWSSRPLTIVGGDFNQRPDGKTGSTKESWRAEEDPDCWYQLLSERVPETGGCTKTPVDGYYDAVREKNPDICPHWSHSQREIPDDPDSCSNSRRRIDFIWIRLGSEGVPDIPLAASDRGYSEDGNWAGTRYSDHRAVRARVTWP